MVFGNVSILCTLVWMFDKKEISLEVVVVPIPRCYRFIRTVMEKISSLSPPSNPSTKLKGNVEGDEFYIKAGLKGRSYHDEIVLKSVSLRTIVSCTTLSVSLSVHDLILLVSFSSR